MTEDGSTILRTGIDVAIHLHGRHFPGRIAKVLKDGHEVDGIEWVGSSGKGYQLELTDGSIVPTGVVTPGDHTCVHCGRRLTEKPAGNFYCTCDDWQL